MTGLTTFAMSRTGQLCRAHKSAAAQFCRSLRRQSGQTRGFFHGLLPHQNQDQFLRNAQDENPFDVADATRAGDTLVVRMKGDGREYMVNIYTKSRRMAFSYRAELPTEKDQWQEIRLPLDQFEPTSFGRVVAGMGPVDPGQVNGFGFMLSDKKPGKFRLEIEWVKVICGAK